MDPISLLLASYLHSDFNGLQDRFSKAKNFTLTPKVVEFKGTKVAFEHKNWKIKASSICSNYQNNLTEYSKCTIKAKEVFVLACEKLTNESNAHWSYKAVKGMYCNSANQYRPVLAQITPSRSLDTELIKLKKSCN